MVAMHVDNPARLAVDERYVEGYLLCRDCARKTGAKVTSSGEEPLALAQPLDLE